MEVTIPLPSLKRSKRLKRWKELLFRKKDSSSVPISELISNAFGFKPKDLSHYKLALTHSSVAELDKDGIRLSNERLEFLGDSVIDSVMADYLYHKFPALSEGELTKMKAKIVSRRSLNYIGEQIGIATCLNCNLGNQDMHRSMLGNAFEALVGAVYLERGYNFTFEKLLNLFKRFEIDSLVHEEIDYKSKLHEWCQKKRKSLKYIVVDEEQKNGASSYTIEVLIDNKAFGSGRGKSKKHAEQEASKKACNSIFAN